MTTHDVLALVKEAKRLRALADAETNLVHQRAIHLEADKIDREIAINNTKTTAALEGGDGSVR